MASASTPSRRTIVVMGGLVILGVIGALLWFLGGDAPDTVDITQAAADVASDETADAQGADDTETDETTGDEATADTEEDPSPAASVAPGADSAEGTWVVDTSIGEFSVLETTGTFVGFRIAEELANVGATEAVGRTPDVDGELTIADGTLTAATITADLTTIQSDRPRRDDRIQSALETGTFPTAIFELTEPVAVEGIAPGAVVEVLAPGTLTVHGVARPVTVPLQSTLQDGIAVVTGSFEITFADHDVQVPTAPAVLSVADVGAVELQLYLTPG